MPEETNITLSEIFEEIIRTRNDLKNSIQASETKVLLKIEDLHLKIKNLEKENILLKDKNILLKDKVEYLEKREKRKNLVIFGLKKVEKISANFICEQLKKLLEVDICEADISNLYWLNKSANSPLKVEFISEIRKRNLLANGKKLKGTDIRIAHDLTLKQRQDYKLLKQRLNELRLNGENQCYIKGNKIFLNNKSYTLEQLQDLEYVEKELPNSAPPTPNIRDIYKELDEPLTKTQIDPVASSSNNTVTQQKINQLAEDSRAPTETPKRNPVKKPTKGAELVNQQKLRTRSTTNK